MIMKKLFPVIAILVLVAMLLPACAPKLDCTKADVFCVGFVTDTAGIADKSFNQTQWEGIQRAAKDLGLHAQYIQSTEASQYTPNLTEFASQGYDLVIAAGFYLGADVAKVAAQYPDVHFAIFDYAYPDAFGVPEGVVGNKECIPNVMGQVFKTDQAAYLAGYLAAGMTKTGKIAFYGGANIPTVSIFGVGLQAGMDAYNTAHGTSIAMLGWNNQTGEGTFTGDFTDLVKAKQTATSLYDEDADIVVGVGGLIGSVSFPLAAERGGYGIWVDTDGYEAFPNDRAVMLTSIMKNMGNSNYAVVKAAFEGKFAGCTNYVGDLANGGIQIAPYHDLDGTIPADLKAEVEALKAKIISGEIKDTGCVGFPASCPTGLYP
jgi:basic membrane protein A and related proteins